MDSMEAARKRAEKVHFDALERGCNTIDLLSFMENEADYRDIEVFPISQGDSRLNGGKALFDSQAEIILYENVGSDFDKAFLIAHEIGHLEIEGSKFDSFTQTVDPDRTAEASPVGSDKVVDYGSRERREIIMDLFARELLVPRTIVKKWHIEEHMSSNAISKRLNAPLNVVQQQLIDALLLPSIISLHKETDSSNVGLDQSQGKAALHRGCAFQLQAGPGTGKTHTLVRRIESLLEEGVEPETILVLTFSNKAAGELRERIASKFPEAVANLWLGTFHSFGLDILHRFHDRMSWLSATPRVVSRYEAIEMLEDEFARLPLKHFRNLYDPTLDLGDMLTAISRAKDEVVTSSEYRKLAEAMLENAEDLKQREEAEKCLDVAQLYEVYESLLQKNDSVDFGDLVSLPVRLVESDQNVRQLLSSRHQHILVDEYQDVNRASVRLLKAIAGEGRRLWVVGDSRQSIYRFRGASSINMKRFVEDFPNAKTEELNVNYRSSKEIVDLYSSFSQGMKASNIDLSSNLHANRGSIGKFPELRVATTADDEVAVLAASVEEMNHQGVDYKDQVILCTSNYRLSEIATTLENHGIPVLFLGSLFERDEIKDLLSLLSMVTDQRATGLIRAATLPGYEMRLEHIFAVQKHIRDVLPERMNWKVLADEVKSLDVSARNSIKRLDALIGDFPPNANPWSVLACIVIDRLGWAKQAAEATDIQGQMKGVALWQLLNFARNSIKGRGMPIDRLLSRIRRLVLLSEDRDLRQLPQAAQCINGVRLMTVHASKGLEFNIVHLPGMVASGLPASNRAPRCAPPNGLIDGAQGLTGLEAIKEGHDEEEECKFFVATSRAKDSLLLYASTQQKGGRRRSLSKYIDRIAPFILQINTPTRISLTPIEPEPFNIKGEALTLTDNQLNQYEKCPRRYLYTHALTLQGKRTESPYMEMHSAVYMTLDWLRQHDSKATLSDDELYTQFMSYWNEYGPVEHGYADDYLRIGLRFMQYLMGTRKHEQLIKPEVLQLSFTEGTINVLPDEITVDIDGSYCIKRIKTGRQAKDEFDRIEYSLLLEAAKKHFGSSARVEVVHLAGETEEFVNVTDRKKDARLNKARSAMSSIVGGSFPVKADSRTCPRCPSFFICGNIPAGDIFIEN